MKTFFPRTSEDYEDLQIITENKKILLKVIDLLIKKKVNFSVNTKIKYISCYLGEERSISSYYGGNLVNYQDGSGTMTLENLFIEIKKR